MRILPFYDNIFISFFVGGLCNEGRAHNAFVGINSPVGLQSLGCCTHCRSAWPLLPWCLLGTGVGAKGWMDPELRDFKTGDVVEHSRLPAEFSSSHSEQSSRTEQLRWLCWEEAALHQGVLQAAGKGPWLRPQARVVSLASFRSQSTVRLQLDFLSFQLKASSESENESPKRRRQKQLKRK